MPYRRGFILHRHWIGADRDVIKILGDVSSPIEVEWNARDRPDGVLDL